RRAKLLYLNYPNNPTGAVPSREFFAHVADFARRHRIFVVHDAAYGALVYDGQQPLSILSIPGAQEVAVEVHSLSKAFNMTGWRLGWVCGNELAVRAFAAVKDNTDSGQFRAIQWAGIRGMEEPRITQEACARYSRRLEMLTAALRAVGFPAAKPRGSFYLYVSAPAGTRDGQRFASAADFAQSLTATRRIVTLPRDDARAYVRFSAALHAETESDEPRVIAAAEPRLAPAEYLLRSDPGPAAARRPARPLRGFCCPRRAVPCPARAVSSPPALSASPAGGVPPTVAAPPTEAAPLTEAAKRAD